MEVQCRGSAAVSTPCVWGRIWRFWISRVLKVCESELLQVGAEQKWATSRGELSYLAPLGSENISAPYFKQCFFHGERGGITPKTESNTTPASPKTEITIILFYILNFASIIKFKM